MGQRLGGRYELGERLGRGGMADVHRATDTVLGREVALKVLRDVTDVDRDRFDSEAHLLARLDHRSIVTLLDAGVEDDRPWLAIELVVGRTLAEHLGEGPMDARDLAPVAQQVAEGLAHAHDHEVVHRDVKPSNVLVTDDGDARLTDFGVARLTASGSNMTLTGHTVGTAAYLAPEQARGEPVTGKSDVYSLGLVLLECVTGLRAYDGPPLEAALARLHRAPMIPTSLPTGWPALLTAMTAADPDDRPSAAHVARRLDQVQRGPGRHRADVGVDTVSVPPVARAS